MAPHIRYDKKVTSRYSALLLALLLILIDYIAVVCAEQSSFVMRNWLVPNGGKLHISWLNFWVVFPAIFLLFINVEHPYNRRSPFYKVIQKIFQASLYATVAIVIELYVGRLAASTSRLFVGMLWIFGFVYITSFRYFFKKVLERYNVLQIPVLIIGAGKTAEILVRGISKDAGLGYKIIGFLEDNVVKNKLLQKYPVLGTFAEAEQVIKTTGVQRVLIAAPGMEQEKLVSLVYKVQPLVKSLGIVPNLIGVPMGGIEVESLFNERLMLLRVRNNLARPLNRFIKVVFDYTLTVLGTIAISPILLIIAIWIYCDSPEM